MDCRARLRRGRRPRVQHRLDIAGEHAVTFDDPGGVVVESTGGLLRITIDRPARKGSLDPESVHNIIDALEAAATDDALRAILLSSTGDDFCSGADWVTPN